MADTNELKELKAAFQDSIVNLKLAHEAWLSEGVDGAYKREMAMKESLLLLGKCFGINFDPSGLRINSLGEIDLNVEPESPAEKVMGVVGNYGKDFALFLSQYNVRTGASAIKGYILPENGWCRINHFEAEKMIMDFSHQLNHESLDKFINAIDAAYDTAGIKKLKQRM